MNTLYILTSEFPYGTREPFLEDELLFLAKEFHKIEIIPFDISNNTARPVPANVIVHKPLGLSRNIRNYRLNGLFNNRTKKYIVSELLSFRFITNKQRFLCFIKFCMSLNNFANSSNLKQLGEQLHTGDVVYSYWGVSTNSLALLWGKKVKFVSRYHGAWDLWEDSYNEYVPFRKQIVTSLSKAVFISHKGEKYFKSKYPEASTITMPLGSKDYGLCVTKHKADGIIRVVSCSTVYPLKRVTFLFETLNSMSDHKIHWTHLGGGPDFLVLKEQVEKEVSPHLQVDLVGQVTHDDVMDYYKNNPFDVFVNLSTVEGVPVSVMEATSFDIPVVATNVGGTSEVVAPECGVLVSPNPTVPEISRAILNVVSNEFTPRAYWQTHYNAETNYTKFAKLLKSLCIKFKQ